MNLKKVNILLLSIIIVYLIYFSNSTTTPDKVGKDSKTKTDENYENPYPVMKKDSEWVRLGKSFRYFRDISSKKEDAEIADLLERIFFPWVTSNFSLNILQNVSGSGVVICSSNGLLTYTLATIAMIRQVHKSNIHIQVFYVGNGDLSNENRNRLREFSNVETVDITLIFNNDVLKLERWSIKPFALLASSFQNVILMDADAVLLQPPEEFYKQPEYTNTGALFYKDRSMTDNVKDWKRAREIAGDLSGGAITKSLNKLPFFTGRTNYQMESGVVVVDKRRHIHALFAVCGLNVGQHRKELYEVTYGEKETFWMAFEALGEEYEFNFHSAAVFGSRGLSAEDGSGMDAVCGPHILHLDSKGRPLWFNGSLNKHKPSAEFVSAEIWTEETPNQNWKWEHGTVCLYTRTPKKFSTIYQNTIKKGIQIMQKLKSSEESSS